MKPTATAIKLVSLVLGAAVTATTFSACSQPKATETTGAEAVTVNNCGKTTTFTTPPMKVLSLGVSGLAYLYAAGAKDKIIARANEHGEPAASWMKGGADDIKIAADADMSVEGVIGLQPDLVYGGEFSSSQLPPERLVEKGIPAVVDQPECHYLYSDQKQDESFDAILAEVSQLGKILGTSDKAEAQVATLRGELDRLAKEKPGAGRKVAFAYYFGEEEGLYSYGEAGVMGDMMKSLDLKTAVDPSYHPHQGPIAPEAFVKSDADLIVVLLGMGGATKESTMQRLQAIPGFNDMKAVKEGKVFYAESAIAYASPTAIHGAIDLASQIK